MFVLQLSRKNAQPIFLLAELENNMGISEKTISEFIIDQAKQATSSKIFVKVGWERQ